MAVIPCKPALIDLQATGSTIDAIRLAKVLARIVINSIPSRGDLTKQAEEIVCQK